MECHGLFIAHIHALDASVLLLPTELIDDGGMAEQSSLWLKSLLAPEALLLKCLVEVKTSVVRPDQPI